MLYQSQTDVLNKKFKDAFKKKWIEKVEEKRSYEYFMHIEYFRNY